MIELEALNWSFQLLLYIYTTWFRACQEQTSKRPSHHIEDRIYLIQRSIFPVFDLRHDFICNVWNKAFWCFKTVDIFDGFGYLTGRHPFCIHKVRFSSISFLKIVLHSFAQNNDLVRILRSIFFALVDKLRTKSWLPFLALPINANVISWATSPFWNSIHAVQFIHELLHGRYDLTNPLPRTPAHRR